MPDIITIGSALVDIFIQSADFQFSEKDGSTLVCQKYGDKLEVDTFGVYPGGGANNTATGFSRMGFSTAVVAEMGQDSFAQTIVSLLETEHVDTSLLIKEKKEQTGGSVILVGKDGGRTAMTHRGAASQLDVADMPWKVLATAKFIHLSSISGHVPILQQLFAQVKAQQQALSWNPGKAELAALVSGQLKPESLAVKVMILNAEEWQSVGAIQPQLQAVIPEILITNGARGCELMVGGQSQSFPAKAVKSVDDTGAGDAFCVGYISARLLGKTPVESIAFGTANAASVVQHLGAIEGLLHQAEILKQVQPATNEVALFTVEEVPVG